MNNTISIYFKIAFSSKTYVYNTILSVDMTINIFMDNIKNILKNKFELYDCEEIQIVPFILHTNNIPAELMEPINLTNESIYNYFINNSYISDNIMMYTFYVRPIYMINNICYQLTFLNNSKYYIDIRELEQVKNKNLNIQDINFLSEQTVFNNI